MGELIGKVLRIDASGVWSEQDEIIPDPGALPWRGAGFEAPPCGQLHCWKGHRSIPPSAAPLPPAPFAFSLDDEQIWLACHADGRATLLLKRAASCDGAPDPLAVLDRLMLAIGAQRAAKLGRLSFPARAQIFQHLTESSHTWCDGSLPANATTRHT